MAPIGAMPVAPTTRAATTARHTAKGMLSSAIHPSIPNNRACRVTISTMDNSSPDAGHGVNRTLARGTRRLAGERRGTWNSRTINEVRVAHTIRLTPGHNSHSTSAANCGPLASGASTTRACSINHGASPPQANAAPISSVRPTRMPMMLPKPISISEGSSVKVRRSRAGVGAQRGIAQTKPSIHFTIPDNSAALHSTLIRAMASRPWL